jgi:tetratricopeptide (TPR) repeat protein
MELDAESGDPRDRLREAQADLARLEAKRAESDDPDIRAALDIRIAQVRSDVEGLEREVDAATTEPEPPAPPTPEQAEEAERLIRQAHVEKVRGNRSRAGDLLRQAAEVAPGSPAVLEALGDDQMERRQYAKARESYGRALLLIPDNVPLQRKHAQSILGSRSDAFADFEAQQSEAMASAPAATMLSVVLPGVGHMVLGETRKGGLILGAWLAALVAVLLLRHQLRGLFAAAGVPVGGDAGGGGALILLPLMIALIIHIGAVIDCASRAKTVKRVQPDRPAPPVDLPFE